MEPLYLKFPSEEVALSVLAGAFIKPPMESPTEEPAVAKYRYIDIIGVMYEAAGRTLIDEEGNEYPEAIPLDGWHVNILLAPGEDRDPLVEYLTFPTKPRRVWNLPSQSAPEVPACVTKRQAKLALLAAGLLEQVERAILASDSEAAKIEWEAAQEFRRDWPTLKALQTGLGLDDKQIDELFILAATL
jgi:hypothetical protein